MASDIKACSEPIAIIGSACRFPGDAISPSKLWELLKEPRDVLQEIPDSRFNPHAFYHPDGSHHGTTNVRHSYLLSDDHRLFDAQFFGTKPVEANSIDPQQRLLLEIVYESLESAGIPMEHLQGSNTGIFVGLMTNDYADLLGRDIQNFPTYFASGTARSILSNRVSYFFDWHGPSMTIDTACSSSLVALHQAVQSLRNGESLVAIAAGTNLLLGPEQYIAESKLKMLSPSGRSRMWDKDADGYARGDGIAAAILKPLSAALADGDHIECIVRETGINQDGRTKGITMPNPAAQVDLIRATYTRAGLDLSKSRDRPQYFEAHGTGTPAGDPVEAEAISRAFFGSSVGYSRDTAEESPLFVGSIKTIIGHTEGTAGLAAVLKVSLSLQHAVIPPNLLLNELNPDIKPFYDNLQIASTAKDWPELSSGTPRRASVNSFGFGGANAHAILESFDQDSNKSRGFSPLLTPFNFSANSETSLLASLQAYSAYLKEQSDLNLLDLSWTLNCRRSTLPVRYSVSASTSEDLITKLVEAVQTPSDILQSSKTSNIKHPKLLGIFTGQGAQWARMGAELVTSSSLAVDCIDSLDLALQSLPREDRPSWSLKNEILKDGSSSRIGEALFSQSLSTAVQIMLVTLLNAAGVYFVAVVGHSSGEIAAAFAAGYLSAADAMKIAYYRGLSLQYSRTNVGTRGAMMAVGTSLEDAQELCDMPSLKGRICVAACNSSTSVTLSGDADAIDEAKLIFEDEKKFCRLLKVDKAYHSHHMISCAAPYIAAMQKCCITIQKRQNSRTAWISSVYSKNIDDINDSLTDTYWSNNMVNPVLFSQAVSFALGAAGPFHMALEVGPHPALKGPALQIIQDVSGDILPYSGTLARGKNDREAFASSLGALWASLGDHLVDFSKFTTRVTNDEQHPRLLKGIPSYSWDHDRVYWHESRMSTVLRSGRDKFHHLLGTKCPDSSQNELRWRNYLHSREIPWLRHHQVQGQIVFPAAAYISSATQLLIEQYGLSSIQLIDFQDLVIGQALVLEENFGVEVIFSLTITETQSNLVRATFNCHSNANKGTTSMSLHASAQVSIIFGNCNHDSLPPRIGSQDPFLQLDEERFYSSVSELGFGYSGPFRALSGLSRKMDEATGMIAVPTEQDTATDPLIIHPATLDGAIQSIMLAYCFPQDGRLRSLYLPTKIDRIRINPSSCKSLAGPGTFLPFYSSVADVKFAELSGDVDIYSSDGRFTVVQLQGLHTTPLVPLTSATDIPLFTEMTWGPGEPTGRDADSSDLSWLTEKCEASIDLERIAYFYLKSLHSSIPFADRERLNWHHRHLLSYALHCVSLVESGTHQFALTQWQSDTKSEILRIFDRNSGDVDFQALRLVGESLPDIVRGEVNILDILMKNDMLSQFYSETIGMQSYLHEMARMAGQISNRYPHINVLEIGAGAGEATEFLIREMDTAFASYTYTDFVENWFDSARDKFNKYESRMAFRQLDIENDIREQGYGEESYDLVIASLALYATKNLEATLSNVRRLVKPGGYLLVLELTNPNVMRFGVILGGLPAWWLGHREGRMLSPCVSVDRWEQLMETSGFSGVDALIPHHPGLPIPFSVMLTQAVDHRISFLRNPFGMDQKELDVESLTILGGKTALTSTLVAQIKEMVGRNYKTIKSYKCLADVVVEELPVMGTVLSLAELDEPTLMTMTSKTLRAFQELFKKSKNILWVGYGAQGDNPSGNMFIGVQRTIVTEMRHLRVQFLDFDSLMETNCETISRRLLHLDVTDKWEQSGQLAEILWYTEPEISMKNGQSFIPRLRLSSQRNTRYNSSKRLIVKRINRSRSTASISRSDSYQVLEVENPKSLLLSGRTEIQVAHSLLRSIMVTETDHLFLIAGKKPCSKSYVVGFAESLDSRQHVPPSWVVDVGTSEAEAIRSMISIYTHFLAESLVKNVLPGKILAILDPEFSLSAVLTQYANQRGVQLVFFTTKDSSCSSPWIHVHRHSTRRELLNKIPPNIARLFNVGGDDEILALLTELLPADCQVDNEQYLTREASQLSSRTDIGQVESRLQAAWTAAHSNHSPINVRRLPTLGLQDLIESHQKLVPQSVISWGQSTLPVQVTPASRLVKFAKNKTYWLVGLTGGLGLSLCQWMARQGARYIALSSRNPKVDESWIRQMACVGCTIRIFANVLTKISDIADRGSVHATHRQIVEEMPPIGGVAQGAMVLQDTMFLDLDLPRLKNVLQPKVQGSILLDEIFSDNSLDFMIFFSSMAALTGNPGQAAYNAANMFMTSLAARRRSRGLPGYAINIGAIVGNGYVTRELNMGQQSYLYKVGHSWMSEQDFHEVFAEGVLSCLELSSGADLCSGLRIDDDDSKDWISNPIFQHLVFKSATLIGTEKKSKAGVAIKSQLLDATSQGQVMTILQDCFTVKLRSALQSDPNKDVLEMSPDELGVDSLVAVDLRSWFLKELGVDIPVLKIFNATSVRDLLEFVASSLPASLVPNYKDCVKAEPEVTDIQSAIQSAFASPLTSTLETLPPVVAVEEKGTLKTFHLDYLPSSIENGSGSSSTSVKAGDSSSDQNEESSSLTSLEDDLDVIEKRAIQRTAPMSFGQSRFWVLKLFVQDQTAFNVTPTFELKGKLRVGDFARAVQVVGERHEALRTFFFIDDDNRPKQGVWKSSSLHLEHTKVTHKNQVDIAFQQMRSHVFNISDGEIMRVHLLSMTPDQHWIIFGFHHINMDGVSFEIFWSELEVAYQGHAFLPDTLQYPDFTIRQLQDYEQGTWAADVTYWQNQFPILPSPLPLCSFSLQKARPSVPSYSSHRAQLRLEPGFSSDIEKCCRMFKVTPFHFHLAVWQIFLQRQLALSNICIGVADSNRTDADILHSLGMFLNLLPIQFSMNDSHTFGEALKDTRTTSQQAFVHSRVPFDVMLSKLNVPRSASYNPIFQAFYNYRSRVEESREFCGCEAKGSLLTTGETSYDFHLDVVNFSSGESLIHLLVQKNLYTLDHAEILLQSYYNLLREFTRNPATKISWPPLFSENDIERGLSLGRGPELKNPWPPTLVHRVDDIVQAYPDRIALKEACGAKLTYSEFQHRTSVIANALQAHGVDLRAPIGVFQSPSTDWICSLMAIWRLGGVYLPLDRKVGLGRLAAITSESQPVVILADHTTLSDFPHLKTPATPINVNDLGIMAGHPVPPIRASGAQTAVFIYTSGSTGTPKGISISHSSYLQQIHSSSHAWSFQVGKETVLHQSSYAWDMSMYQILMSLCNGGTLVIATQNVRGDSLALTDLIVQEKVTTLFATPSEYLAWFRHGRHSLQHCYVTTAVSGGERFPNALIRDFQSLAKSDLRLFNAYGPAEVTIASSSAQIPYMQIDLNSDCTPLRLYTLPNYSVYIVDEKMSPVALGVPGEVVIGGAGVAQGYLIDDKGKERFLLDQHASSFFRAQGWTTIHPTGDKGYLGQDGGLVLLGRIEGDNQIKVGGIRINLEEIESVIVDYSGGAISQTIVSARFTSEEQETEPFLVAFAVIADTHIHENVTQYLQGLARNLPVPQYMRPSVIIAVDSIPQNVSGKADRRAINNIPISPITIEMTDDQSLAPLEETLLRLWREAIPKELVLLHSIYFDSDFFHVGGSSISLANLQSLINSRLGISIPLYELFEASTLREMAHRIQNLSSTHSAVSVDWGQELESMLARLPVTSRIEGYIASSKPRVVVLTGATGFIGKEILQQLVEDDRINIVYCIAVRKPLAQLPTIFANSKVHVFHGNLGSPQLGLSEADVASIFSHVDCIIHNGADVSFMKSYQSLKLINVASTEELVRLALPRNIPFHFISSASVTRLAAQTSFGEKSLASYEPPAVPKDGYTTAKWVCEVYLERTSQLFGLPVCLHRPSSVTGIDAPELDLMSNVVKYCQKIKKVPDSASWSGVLDFISVKSAAAQIIESLYWQDSALSAPQLIRYQYESGEIQVGQKEVRSVMESGTGELFETVPVNSWIEDAEAAGMNSLLVVYLRQVSDGEILLPRLIKDKRSNKTMG
ncbi:hypothetical protein N7462_006744 [Penicillium macrosclerotiorum]|uniref:uncharacterized protein n=1 Tax=Penicillium macrosclerotiorum TaxID=303699 RepID=UPI002546604B|nr:uncharacterized protein N7462_006744 [Penicillium macrosclerotiorum]KAJ5683579.1 hypothetical protein N7462_006744 [Penicillium macrosclerotiorum]